MYTLNLNKCSKAAYELANTMKSCAYAIAFIQEPPLYAKGITGFTRYLNLSAPISDRPRAAIIATKNISLWPSPSLSSPDVAVALWKRSESEAPIVLISMYCPSTDSFDHLLPALQYAQRNNYQVIMSGDSNARSTLWGYPVAEENARGVAFDNFIAPFPLRCLNQGRVITWRAGSRHSTIDVAFCTQNLLEQITSWKVSSSYSSDHSALEFNIRAPPALPQRAVGKADWSVYQNHLVQEHKKYSPPIKWSINQMESESRSIIKSMLTAFNKGCPLSTPKPHSQAVPWWNESIGELKTLYHNSLMHWYDHPSAEAQEAVDAAKLTYYKAIVAAKTASWHEYLSQVTTAHEMAALNRCLEKDKMKPIGLLMLGDVTASGEESVQLLADTHFPGHIKTTLDPVVSSRKRARRLPHAQLMNNHKYLDVEYVRSIFSTFGALKACGPDGIRPILLHHLPEVVLQRIVALYKATLVFGYTPRILRENNVIFLPKAGKDDYSLPKSYRPITLAPFLLKGLEKAILWRLESTILKRTVFSKHQHAFLPDRGCDSALSDAFDYVEKATLSNKKALCVSIDIRGAFDNVDIEAAIAALKRKRLPFWALRWYEHYLKSRFSTISINGSKLTFLHTRGTPQGGVCSPILWIIVFDDLLDSINLGTGARAVGYADDCLIIIYGDDMDVMETIAQHAIAQAEAWGLRTGLTICPDKSKAIVFSSSLYLGRRPRLLLNGKCLPVVSEIKYLGVIFDSTLSFHSHIVDKIDKGKKLLAILNSIVSSKFGPVARLIRWAFQAIALPRLTYACHIWGRHAQRSSHRVKLRKLSRLACLAIASPFPHSPTSGLEVLCNITPLHLSILNAGFIKMVRVKHSFSHTWIGRHRSRLGHRLWWEHQFESDIPDWYSQIAPPSTTRNIFRNFSICTDLVSTPPDPLDLDVFTDGSRQRVDDVYQVGQGAQVYSSGVKTIHQSFRLPDYCSVSQAELDAILQIGRRLLNISTSNRRIRVFSDSLSSLFALRNTRFRSDLESQTLATWISLANRNTVSFHWVKAHVNIPGNERADFLAKAGTELPSVTSPLPPPRHAIKPFMYKVIAKRWQLEWENRPDCEQTRYWLPFVPTLLEHAKHFNLTRPEMSLVTQFITGFNNFGRHTKNKGEISYGPCRLCGHPSEFSWHLATDCPMADPLRFAFFGSAGPEDGCWDIPGLLAFIKSPPIYALLTTRHPGRPLPPAAQ